MDASTAKLYLGIDLGTSGCRGMVIDRAGQIHGQHQIPLAAPIQDAGRSEQDPELWWQAVTTVLQELLHQVPAARLDALAIDGTSGTLLLADPAGQPVAPALMYNDARAQDEARRIDQHAPFDSAAHGPTSALAKLLYMQSQPYSRHARYALHQADWIAARFTGRYGISDENNSLKLGYDIIHRCWPAWFRGLSIPHPWLPKIVTPGTTLGTVCEPLRRQFALPNTTRVVAGTTDSIAAFVATGATQLGEAVTSLGSTLVIKIITARPIFAPLYGVYSHRLGQRWLAGGASNSGGAVLKHFFSVEQMEKMTRQLTTTAPTGLNYYPLLSPGERFPINDPQLPPRLSPRPENDLVFFQGLLEGIAEIESKGYHLLAALGAPYPSAIRTVGGGAHNRAWTQLRAALLKVPLLPATHEEAAYGAALIASGYLQETADRD